MVRPAGTAAARHMTSASCRSDRPSACRQPGDLPAEFAQREVAIVREGLPAGGFGEQQVRSSSELILTTWWKLGQASSASAAMRSFMARSIGLGVGIVRVQRRSNSPVVAIAGPYGALSSASTDRPASRTSPAAVLVTAQPACSAAYPRG